MMSDVCDVDEQGHAIFIELIFKNMIRRRINDVLDHPLAAGSWSAF